MVIAARHRRIFTQRLEVAKKSHLNSATPREKVLMNAFVRTLATVLVAALAGGFALLGCFLIVRGLGALLGAFFIGRHAFVAIAIMILLGTISLVMASFVCLGVPLVWNFRRNRGSEWPLHTVPHLEVRLHILGHQECPDGGPLYSGFRATFRHHDVVDDVTLVLLGASQLASGEEGTARLSFGDLARHQADLQKGSEFEILDREHRCICRGTVVKILDQD
jgi:hypothetical protein